MLFLSGFKLYSRWVPLFERVERLVQLTKLFNQSRFGSTMQLQSSLFSRGVLLSLHDFSIQSTVVFLIINFLTSYFAKDWVSLYANFVNRRFSYTRGFSCAVSGFRHPAADEASRRTREKTSAEGCRSVLPKSSCFDSCFDHNPMRAVGAKWEKNAVSLECYHLLLMSFRMVSAYFLSSLSIQE